MSAQSVNSTNNTQSPAIQPAVNVPVIAIPAAISSASSIASVQNANVAVRTGSLVLPIEVVHASNIAPAAIAQKVITFPDGSTYTGEIKNGYPHGAGVLQYASSDKKKRQKYEGEFSNGFPHGKGTMIWVVGDKYVGEWKNGKMHGNGKHTYADGKTYEGAYKNDQPNGPGIMKWTHQAGTFERAEGTFNAGELWEGTRSCVTIDKMK